MAGLLTSSRTQRAPSFAMAKLGRERREFLRDQQWGLLGATLVVIAAVTLIAVTGRNFANGLLIGAGVASLGWAVYYVVAFRSYNAHVGANAERWTKKMLKGAPEPWRCIPNVPFENYDVDYVVVTADAVLAVEVKWRPQLTPKQQRSRHAADLDQAMRSHDKMRAFLYSCRLRGLPVVPVLLLWGPGTPNMVGGRSVEGEVHVLDGNEFNAWKHHYETGHRLMASIDALTDALKQHIAKVEKRPQTGRPTRTGGS